MANPEQASTVDGSDGGRATVRLLSQGNRGTPGLAIEQPSNACQLSTVNCQHVYPIGLYPLTGIVAGNVCVEKKAAATLCY